jgi:hypothetical protein
MHAVPISPKKVLAQLESLSPDCQAEVVDFIEFLYQRNNNDTYLIKTANKLSEPSFREVWDNPEDAVYDNL